MRNYVLNVKLLANLAYAVAADKQSWANLSLRSLEAAGLYSREAGYTPAGLRLLPHARAVALATALHVLAEAGVEAQACPGFSAAAAGYDAYMLPVPAVRRSSLKAAIGALRAAGLPTVVHALDELPPTRRLELAGHVVEAADPGAAAEMLGAGKLESQPPPQLLLAPERLGGTGVLGGLASLAWQALAPTRWPPLVYGGEGGPWRRRPAPRLLGLYVVGERMVPLRRGLARPALPDSVALAIAEAGGWRGLVDALMPAALRIPWSVVYISASSLGRGWDALQLEAALRGEGWVRLAAAT